MSAVFCARRSDLGCTASYQDNKFAAIRAYDAGWFRSYQEEESYCPAHVPDWVPAWRAAQAKKKFEVDGAFTSLPAQLSCSGCAEKETVPGDDEEQVKDLRAKAFQHGRETGHTVSVRTSHVLVVEPVRDAVDA